MFLFSMDYLKDFLSRPGGFADYLGTFFTQFYFVAWQGALIIVLLLILLQWLLQTITSRIQQLKLYTIVTYLPSVFFMVLLCDENYLLATVIAIVINLLVILLYQNIKRSGVRLVLLFLFIPLLYWFTGGAFVVFGLLALILEWKFFCKFSKTQWIVAVVAMLVLTVVSPLISKMFLQYPLQRLLLGISYNRYPVVSTWPIIVIWCSVVLIPFLFSVVTIKISKSHFVQTLVFTLQVVLLFGLEYTLVHSVADFNKERIMEYDYLVRNEQWDRIVTLANQKDPASPLSVTCLNLALSEKGIMGECMFRYFQNGPEGLLPTFQRDFTSPFIAGEAYYHLGFLNTAMRYAFEAMEAIPDYKKSARAVKRIAEVNLLNGENKVAVKYLKLLQKTLYYRDWANKAMLCVGNDKLIDSNPEWAELRKYRVTKDFLFSEDEKDQMLGLLFTHSMTNRMAYDYLMAYLLLTKDLNHFVEYFPLGQKLGYKTIPAHYQEALIYLWSNKSPNLNGSPWPIDPQIKRNMANYIGMYTSGYATESQMYSAFSQTYWFYLQYRK